MGLPETDPDRDGWWLGDGEPPSDYDEAAEQRAIDEAEARGVPVDPRAGYHRYDDDPDFENGVPVYGDEPDDSVDNSVDDSDEARREWGPTDSAASYGGYAESHPDEFAPADDDDDAPGYEYAEDLDDGTRTFDYTEYADGDSVED